MIPGRQKEQKKAKKQKKAKFWFFFAGRTVSYGEKGLFLPAFLEKRKRDQEKAILHNFSFVGIK